MSTTWIVMDVDDVADFLNAPQLSAFQSKVLKAGQADPVASVIHDVLDGVRLSIASGGYILSATPHAIPPELRVEVGMLIVAAIWPRLAIALTLTKDQSDAIARASAKLIRIEAGKLQVSTPSDPATTPEAQGGSAIQVATYRAEPKASPEQMDGL